MGVQGKGRESLDPETPPPNSSAPEHTEVSFIVNDTQRRPVKEPLGEDVIIGEKDASGLVCL